MKRVHGIINRILLLCFLSAYAVSACASSESQLKDRLCKTVQKAVPEETTIAEHEQQSDEPSATEPVPDPPSVTEPEPDTPPAPELDWPITLFFASDYQYLGDWPYPEDTLQGILETAEEDGKAIDAVIYCGDYSNVDGYRNYEIDPEEYIAEIRGIVNEFVSDPDDPDTVLFVQGNHDILTESIAASGLHEYDGYLVYVMNTQNDFPWWQGITEGSRDKVENSAAKLKSCLTELAQEGETRPVFIAAHVPLHFTGRTSSLYTVGDNLYASMIFEVLNEAGESLDLIYLYGHNHAKGWDSYLGGSCVFRQEGDFLLVPDYTSARSILSADGQEEPGKFCTDAYTQETLHFTYLSAGYTGYYTGTSADRTLTGTVCEIYPDRMEFTRYEDGGQHNLSSEGSANPYIDDSELIPEDYYGKELEGGQTIRRKGAQ